MPAVSGRKNDGFTGKIKLKRLSPPVLRHVPFWEYEEPYRLGKATIFHVPGFRSGWILGWWDERTAKDMDDHELIEQHLLEGMQAMQGKLRGYFVDRGGQVCPLRDDQLVS